MFNDVKVSDERVPKFKQYCEAKGKNLEIDLQVTVLNDLYWPLSKQTEITLPKELIPCVKAFEEYYASQTDKRRLTWLYNQGNVVMNHTIIDEKKRKRKIELTVSCIQACILLLFNESPAYKFGDIREILGTTEEMLKFSITPLVFSNMRILANKGSDGKGKQKGKDEDEGDEANKLSAASLQPEDIIQLTQLRTGGKLKIAYPQGHAGMLASERDGMVKKNLEERIIKIELALVRIMKARGTLKQQELIAESTKQLVKFFKPDPRLMKKRIENLMERGFMRRDEDDQTVIHYQA
jgi:cullin 1